MATPHSQYTIRLQSAPSTETELARYRNVLMSRISKMGEKDSPSERRSNRPGGILKPPRAVTAPKRSFNDISVIFETRRAEKSKVVYLYFQLQSIANLPQDKDKRYFLNLQHNATNYSETKEMTGNKRLGSFSIPIEQDVDIANFFSDEPLLITITSASLEKSNDLNEKASMELADTLTIAQGQIDIVPFLTSRRSITNKDVFLYPTSIEYLNVNEGTCKTAWHVYSLMPIIKNVDFNNMIFITLESIYNASKDIVDVWYDLGVKMSFRSKIADEKGEFVKTRICTYKLFDKCTIAEQDPKYKWASVAKSGQHSLGQTTDCSLTLHKIFNDLLCTENVDFGFDKILIHTDEALVCNLMRRYILSEEWSNILEDVIAFDEQEIVVEVYHRNEPDVTLLQGFIDLSIFLYPNVNSCRFAVQLRPIERPNTPNARISAKPLNAYQQDGKVTFMIVNICTLQPLTDRQLLRHTFYGENMDLAKVCVPEKYLNKEPLKRSTKNLCEESYKNFDSYITKLTDYIIRKEVQNIEDAKGFLCCQMNDLTQKIMKLISCDFNIKMPTKNTIEFSNLMTYVYKSLENRCYELLKNHEKNSSLMADTDRINKISLCMSTIKILKECGEEVIALAYEKKLKKLETTELHAEGYLFIYNMEKQNFEEARKYIYKPSKEKFAFGHFYDDLFEIYINYMEILKAETKFNEGLEYLLSNLESYALRFPKEPSIWILLYSLYKDCGYKPGMSFTRWRYENINPQTPAILIALPLSLWDLYCKRNLELKTNKSRFFYETFQIFCKLGLYKFAQIIFKQIQGECTEAEKYFINTALAILLKEVNDKYHIRTFQGAQNTLFQSHINGHLHYYLGNIAAANTCYAIITSNIQILDYIELYQLGVMRHGMYLFQLNKYKDAISQFKHCAHIKSCQSQAYFNIGKAYYRLGNFDKAEQELALSTHCGVHVPDVWAFLALVNLKSKNITKALESWKYAQFNPDNILSKEIYDELDKIDLSEVTLMVDYRQPPKSRC